MKSDRELVSWFQKYVQGFFELSTDLRNGLALISFVEIVGGNPVPHSNDPKTIEECHRNCTIALMALFRLYENLEVDISADDLVSGNVEKARILLDALASDEWCIELDIPLQRPPFDPNTCDLTKYKIESILCIQAAFRRYRDTMIQKSLKKKQIHRMKILIEIKETEELYTANLDSLVNLYYEPLSWKAQVAAKSKTKLNERIITQQELAQIFANIVAIRDCNKNLLDELSQRMNSIDCTTSIGDIFVKFAPYFRIYTQYYNNFEAASLLLDKLRSERPLFHDFLDTCIELSESNRQPLESLLINPVQRLPRYILLLKELYGNTHKSHPDYSNIGEAILQVQKQANTLNKKIQKSQAANEVILIQNKLVGDDIPNLVSPSRFYITEGEVKEVNLDRKQGRDFQKIYVFLFNDTLLTTKKITHNVFRYRHVIKLAKPTRIKDIMDLGVLTNAFTIISSRKTLTLSCNSETQKTDWMTIMTQQIAQNMETSRSRTILLPEAPVLPTTTLMSKTATVTGTRTTEDSNGKFTEYSILVTTYERGTNYTVFHRYREFDALAKNLKRKFPEEEFIELPRKHMLHNLSSDIVHSRRIVLETFLEDILSKPHVRQSDEFVIFLSPSDRIIAPSKKITKLKQPEHLKKKEDERRKTMKKSKTKRNKQRRKSTLEDIFSKMGPASSFEDLLPSQPNQTPPKSPFVELELQSSQVPQPTTEEQANKLSGPPPKPLRDFSLSHSNDSQDSTEAIESNGDNHSPVRIVRRGGRGRGRGRGTNIPRPASPRVIRLRPPTIAMDVEKKNFMESLNRTIGGSMISCSTGTLGGHMIPKDGFDAFNSSVDISHSASAVGTRPLTSIPRQPRGSSPAAVKQLPPVPPRSSRSQIRDPKSKIDKRRSHSLTRPK